MMELLKNIARYFYYKEQRAKVKREKIIRKEQNISLRSHYSNKIDTLIIFVVNGADFTTGTDLISGGILSIASIYEETEKIIAKNDQVIMVTAPNAHLLLKHTQFPNKIPVHRFSQLGSITQVNKILVHIPEFKFNEKLVKNIVKIFDHISLDNIHLNILNQRIDIMPKIDVINKISKMGIKITQTTAHERYSTLEIRQKYGIPLHQLSVFATPARYKFISWEKKENLILVSPDKGELKDQVLSKIRLNYPNYEIQIINNLTYIEYLSLVERAKFTITFGEGLDFYFIETVYSGGVSIAVYNEDFFTPIFKDLVGVFNSYPSMLSNISSFITDSDCEIKFKEVNKSQFDAVYTIYSGDSYKKNLEKFYKQDYTFK